MAAICNLAVALSPSNLRDKKRLANDAGLELIAAVSDTFKALELRQHGDGVRSASVYISSAISHLRNASELLGEVGTLLKSKELSTETAAWYRVLDYDRLYQEGVAGDYVPAAHELWAQLVELLAARGPAGLCDEYRDRVDQTVTALMDWLENVAELSADAKLVRAQSAIVCLTTYAQFVAYINKLEPLNEQWVRSPAAAVAQA